MTAHADLSLVGSPGFNQPINFRPLFVDNSLPHQIRFRDARFRLGTQEPGYGCVCGVEGGAGYAIEALAWYREHLRQNTTVPDGMLQDDVSSSNVALVDLEG